MSEYVYTRNFVLLAGTLVYVILNFILNIEDLKLWTCQMCAIYPIARAIIKVRAHAKYFDFLKTIMK